MHLEEDFNQNVEAAKFLGRTAVQLGKGLLASGPSILFAKKEFTPVVGFRFLARDLEGLAADNPITVAVAEETLLVTGSRLLKAGAWAATAGVVVTLEETAVKATYTAVASDIYVVLSRGRGP